MRTTTPPTKTATGGTRLTVQRVCDGCGQEVGDATEAELECAVSGVPLPSVASEHGCQRGGGQDGSGHPEGSDDAPLAPFPGAAS